MKRRTFIASCGALLLPACASPPRGGFEATEVPAPQWQVGDSWTFRRTDGYNNLPRGVLTRTVESADQNGIRIVTRTETGSVLDDALFASPGIELSGTPSEDGPVRGAFTPPLRMHDFPLASGKEWRQSLVRTDANGFRIPVATSMRVEGWEQVTALGKSYRALVIRRSFNLGPKDPFTGVLQRDELEWYVPELRGAARMQVDERIAILHRRRTSHPGDRFRYALESCRLG
jgi:hypothetical protein